MVISISVRDAKTQAGRSMRWPDGKELPRLEFCHCKPILYAMPGAGQMVAHIPQDGVSSGEIADVIARLIRQVEVMVAESGRPEGFDAAAWTSRWLREPVPALGGALPLDLIRTPEGAELVSDILARMQSGAYT